jgi:CheY-like chemotaxis protein
VILPVAQADVPALPERRRSQLDPVASLYGTVVLCIDNELRILEGMRLLLEGWGCTVTLCRDQASAASCGVRPDIVLADYHLDGENGFDAIRTLKKIHGFATPAILITADRSGEVRQAAELMEVPVINKPLKPAVLRSMMTRLRRMTPAAAE